MLVLSACQNVTPTSCKLALATHLKLRSDGRHLFTDTILNGVATNMILDTGAQETTFSSQAAKRLHLNLVEHGYAEGLGGRQIGYQFTARTFQIGTLHGRDLDMMASEMGVIGPKSQVDGLLGDNFLAAYDLDLDLPEHQAILYAELARCPSPAVVLTGDLYTLPMVAADNHNDHRPRVHVQIDGKTVSALVDSGAPNTLIFRGAANRIGLRLAELTQDPHFQAGGIGPERRLAVRHVLTPVTIGNLTVRNLPAAIVDQGRLGQDEMLLGLDFLSRVHVWFSFSSHTLVMQYPPLPSPHS